MAYDTTRISGAVLAALTQVGRTCTVARPSVTLNSIGETSVTFVTATVCLAALQPIPSIRQPMEIDVGGKRVAIERIAALPNVSIAEGYRIYESATIAAGVRHWHVNRVLTLAGHKKALVSRPDPGGDHVG